MAFKILIVMTILVVVCYITMYRTFNLYLETLERYEREEDKHKVSILEDTLKVLRKRMKIMSSLSIVIMLSTPVIILTSMG